MVGHVYVRWNTVESSLLVMYKKLRNLGLDTEVRSKEKLRHSEATAGDQGVQ